MNKILGSLAPCVKEYYGENPPQAVTNRVAVELELIEANGASQGL